MPIIPRVTDSTGLLWYGLTLVVLAYKGGSGFFVGYIGRGFIINTHPPGEAEKRADALMYV